MKSLGKNYIYGFDVDNSIVNTLKKSAEKYEKNLYSQIQHLTDERFQTGDRKKVSGYTPQKLKEALKTSKIEGVNSQSNSDLWDLVDYVEQQTWYWLNTTPDGKDYIEAGGFNKLMQDLQRGGFIDNKGQYKPLSTKRLDGLRKELVIALRRAQWAYAIDEKSVIVETNKFNNTRYPEGSGDFVIKFSKDESMKSRRPIVGEAKSSIDSFNVGSINTWALDKIFTPKSIRLVGNTIKVQLDKKNFEQGIAVVFNNKFMHGRHDEFGGMNTPFFEDYNGNILLFSEFIADVGSRGIGVRDFDADMDFYRNLTLKDLDLQAESRLTEDKIKQTYKNIMKKNINLLVWYGKRY